MVCESQCGIPLEELWDDHPDGFSKGMFAVLRGYIDESIKSEKKLFSLSCLISEGSAWSALQSEWKECLRAKNAELRKANRKQIRRFHASDCSNRKGDFTGWSVPEQVEFVQALLAIFKRHPFNVHSYGVHLGEMVEEIPVTAPNPVGFAYVSILSLMLLDMAETTLDLNPGLLRLFHDHCDYDAALIEAFNHMVEDDNLKHRHRFISLAPERWEYCIPLQPADLIAYENLKELERRYDPRDRRKSLKSILDDGRMGGSAGIFDRPNLKVMRQIVDDLDDYSKEILLANARIKAKHAGV